MIHRVRTSLEDIGKDKKLNKASKGIIFFTKIISAEAYFDLSENNIKIETDFNGKEIIIFGILNDDQETLITIKGPEKNAVIQKKERILGFWFNTKQITYNQIPSIFFIASSANITDILPTSTIIKEEMSFDYLLENKLSHRNFISNASLDSWKNNFVRIKKDKSLFKEYKVEEAKNAYAPVGNILNDFKQDCKDKNFSELFSNLITNM